MKIYIAYTLVVIGVPFFIGPLFGNILNLPILLILRLTRGKDLDFQQLTSEEKAEIAERSKNLWLFTNTGKIDVQDLIGHASLDILGGFSAVLTAALLFHFFGLPLRVAVLIIITAWEIFFTICYKTSLRRLCCLLVGILVGWFVVLWL
jgi:hypothetical protein